MVYCVCDDDDVSLQFVRFSCGSLRDVLYICGWKVESVGPVMFMCVQNFDIFK